VTRSLSLVLIFIAGCTTQPDSTSPEPFQQPPDTGGISGRGNRSPYIVFGKTYEVMPTSLGYLEIGLASWYGRKFHGRLTSNGERFDMHAVSAAHKALPLPTFVRVTNLDNGQKVIVRVNDRGPFHDDRVIDLSYEAAVKLGFADKGIAPVVVESLDELNYPDLVKGPVEHESFYLQVGAYSRLEGAETMRANLERVIEFTEFEDVDVRILQSELDQEVILHKVWLGPIDSETERDALATLVEASALGMPLRVKVD
jgi:rare lipoprotein A